jgi:peptide/nickel transport system ATP-binding protein/oligopeptide transport system ATP-binding protein
VSFATPAGEVRAVNGVSFDLPAGQTLGIVGESGSGKSVTALAVLGLVPCPPGTVTGAAHLEGRNLLGLPAGELRFVRGNRVAMIFQEPMTSLNPVFTVGAQIREAIMLHSALSRRAANDHAIAMLAKVGIPAPAQRAKEYPHQLSGGMRQRAMIAMALACNPKVLLADEPTTALDVTIQAQIVDLMRELQGEYGTAVMLISHDMGLVAETCDRIAIMYAGRIVEISSARQIFASPQHPYTAGLLGSMPRLRLDRSARREAKLPAIPGMVPDPARLSRGCAFRPRCGQAMDVCGTAEPSLREITPGHMARCWLHER